MAWSVQATNDLQGRGIPSACIVSESWREQAYNLADNVGVARGQIIVLPKDFSFWDDGYGHFQGHYRCYWLANDLLPYLGCRVH